RATATSTCCATRCRWTGSRTAASTSAPRAARSTAHPTAATPGLRSCATCRRCCRSRCRRWHDGGCDMTEIRVVLPGHLRTLAHVGAEVSLDVVDPPTLGGVVEAVEAAYPVLRGTIRDQATGKRRSFVRYFACNSDLSHDPPDTPLPAQVVSGAEPFMV